MIYLEPKDLKRFREACQHETTYSLNDACVQTDISCEQLMKQEKIDTKTHSKLEICRLHCFYNAANLTNNLPNKIALKHMCENNQDFKRIFYDQQ